MPRVMTELSSVNKPASSYLNKDPDKDDISVCRDKRYPSCCLLVPCPLKIPRFRVLSVEPKKNTRNRRPGTECDTRGSIVKLESWVQKILKDHYWSKILWNSAEIPSKTASNDEESLIKVIGGWFCKRCIGFIQLQHSTCMAIPVYNSGTENTRIPGN